MSSDRSTQIPEPQTSIYTLNHMLRSHVATEEIVTIGCWLPIPRSALAFPTLLLQIRNLHSRVR